MIGVSNHVSLTSTINNLHFATFGTVVDICRYINILEGEAKQSKVKSIMKWWSKCISMVITKDASRNIAFKAAKMSETAFETQAAFVTRGVGEALSLEFEHESLGDLGRCKR